MKARETRKKPAAKGHSHESEVAGHLSAHKLEILSIVLALRDVILEVVPNAEESVLWGALSYHLPAAGGRVKGAVCMIVVRNGKVRLDFIHGVWLHHPTGLLHGDGVSKRFMMIDSPEAAWDPAVRALIAEAAELPASRSEGK